MSPLDKLRQQTGRKWRHLTRARVAAERKRQEIAAKLVGDAEPPRGTSLVVFGSLARGELTPQSDADWTLLVDGVADAGHVEAARRIEKTLTAAKLADPGSSGTFGSMAFSHDLVHLIGGQEDTNRNTTRRVLLLLESAVVGNSTVHQRVRTSILRRYVEEGDVRLVSEKDRRYKVPRFLLNDIVRFWRTMAVDFASKHHAQGGRKWGVRNIKLRLSRKLIFVAGMFNCLYCRLSGPMPKSKDGDVDQLVRFLYNRFDTTPLDVLAQAVLDFGGPQFDAERLFDVYNDFIGILANRELRDQLDAIDDQSAADEPLFNKLRDMSHRFQQDLLQLFFRGNKELCELTQEYGVF